MSLLFVKLSILVQHVICIVWQGCSLSQHVQSLENRACLNQLYSCSDSTWVCDPVSLFTTYLHMMGSKKQTAVSCSSAKSDHWTPASCYKCLGIG